MTRKTISAKVTPELALRISQTGYSVSDILNVGLNLFLNLPRDEQDILISKQIKVKNQERVQRKYFSVHFR